MPMLREPGGETGLFTRTGIVVGLLWMIFFVCSPTPCTKRAAYPLESPLADLAEARRLIEKHGYRRRKK